MTTPQRVMLLIDADNVSTDVIEQAISRLHAEYGALHVRRAYGTAENAVKHQNLFKRLSIKPMVNLAAGKNSTDIALAVDAIDLVLSERPDVVVIASSDSDFAPLVARIREKGCHVRGVGQKGKVGEETPLIYDDFIEFEHRASRRHAAPPAAAPAARTGRGRASRSGKSAPPVEEGAGVAATAAASSPAPSPEASPIAAAKPKSPAARTRARKTTAAEPVGAAAPPAAEKEAPAKPARKRATRASAKSAATEGTGTAPEAASKDAGDTAAAAPAKRPARKRAAAAPAAAAPAPPLPDKVARAFEVLPALAAGERLDVQSAAAVLRKERVFSNADSWPKFFDRYKDWFDLTPHGRPTHVRRRMPS